MLVSAAPAPPSGCVLPANPNPETELLRATTAIVDPHYNQPVNGADLVALNKCDHPMAHTAKAEIQARLDQNGKGQNLHATTAARHFDPGVDALFAALARLGHLAEATGGEKPCHVPSP